LIFMFPAVDTGCIQTVYNDIDAFLFYLPFSVSLLACERFLGLGERWKKTRV